MSVKVYLRAGLGNQLFMIFAGFAYAIKNNKEFKIISYFNSAMCGNYTYWNNILKTVLLTIHKVQSKNLTYIKNLNLHTVKFLMNFQINKMLFYLDFSKVKNISRNIITLLLKKCS